MPTTVSTHHAKLSEAMRGDDNCHLHIGKTINLSRGMRSCPSHGRSSRLTAAGDDIYTLYVHNDSISVSIDYT